MKQTTQWEIGLRRLRPDVFANTESLHMANDTAPLTWEEYNESGRRLFADGDLAGAEHAFTAAIAEAESSGEDPLHLASSLSSLAQLKYQQKDALQAEELFRRALALREQALGPDDKSVITSINNLAALYVSRGELDEAEPLLKRAMTASVKRVESSQGDLAINLNNLARLYFKRGDFSQAEPLLMRLLTLKRPMGPEHPEVATVLVSLAKVRQALGKYEAAERIWRRVLAVRERTLAAGDPAVLQTIDGLADALAAQGKLAPACELRERALASRAGATGAEHPLITAMRGKLEETKMALAASTSSTTIPIKVKRPASLDTTGTGLTPITDRAPIELNDRAPIELETGPIVVAKTTTRRPTPAPAAAPAAKEVVEPHPPTNGESGFGGRLAAATHRPALTPPVQWIEPTSKPGRKSVPVEQQADEPQEPQDEDESENLDPPSAPQPSRKGSLKFGKVMGDSGRGSNRTLVIALSVIAVLGCLTVGWIIAGPTVLAKLHSTTSTVAVTSPARRPAPTAPVPAAPTPATVAATPAPETVATAQTQAPAPTPAPTPVAAQPAAATPAPAAPSPAPVAPKPAPAGGQSGRATGFASHMGRTPAPDTGLPTLPQFPNAPAAAATPAQPAPASAARSTTPPPDQDDLPTRQSANADSAGKKP
jgi:tetratricopeptide (TPR) repeat protein